MTVNDPRKRARQLRIEALRIHKELLDKFTIEETREIIRQLATIEAVLSREEDDTPVREVDEA